MDSSRLPWALAMSASMNGACSMSLRICTSCKGSSQVSIIVVVQRTKQGRACMRTQACADKLDHELTKYGVPPKFPSEEETAAAEAAAAEVWG